MTDPMRLEEQRKTITEKILNLTLEIIYLVTGEDYKVVKKTSTEHMTAGGHPYGPGAWTRSQNLFMVDASNFLILERYKGIKILEVTQKIIELLTGEVPIRCQDVTVYFSMEEWEYIEGHKDLYKDVMMENRPPLTSPYGSSNRNPPERCPRPLYSWYLDHKILQEDQTEHLIKVEVTEREETFLRTDVQCKTEKIPTDGSSNRNPPERCPRPLYSWDSTQEHQKVPPEEVHFEDLIVIKVEAVDEEEPDVIDDEPYKQKEIPPEISTDGKHSSYNTEECSIILPNGGLDDEVMSESPEEDLVTPSLHPAAHSRSRSSNPSAIRGCSPDPSPPVPLPTAHRRSATFQCPECSKCFFHRANLVSHQRTHTEQKPYSCSICSKCFKQRAHLVSHLKSHSGMNNFSCSQCGKCFKWKSNFIKHERIHTGEKPFSCSTCGKCFAQKSDVVKHERIHSGEKPYACMECGKSFTDQSHLVKHLRIHTGHYPFSCVQCGKGYSQKSHLETHRRMHAGERPYSCSVCGKCFSEKSILVRHEKAHEGKKPYSCSECGKCFLQKSELAKHQRTHTGEKPYSCSECGKCFAQKADLARHQRTHTGEKPFSCNECGRCFTQKSNLVGHRKMHLSENL